MKVALALLALLIATPHAWAGSELDGADFQAALARELAGVPIDGQLDVSFGDDGTATVTYTRPDGAPVSRTVRLPPRREDAIETLVLLAANLIRDPTAGLDDPPRAEREPGPADSLVQPRPATTPSAAVRTRLVPLGFGLVAPLSTDLVYGEEVAHRFAMHVLLGDARGVRGASVAGAVDLQRGTVEGLQLAGVASIATDDVTGAQVALGASVTSHVVRGIQVGGAVNAAGDVHGAQLTIGGNLTTRAARGVQVAGVFNAAGVLRGAQLAAGVNLAGDSHGLQLAPVNLARRNRGLQLGLVNYSDGPDGGWSLGLVSIVRRGITEADAVVESHGGVSVLLRHGRRRFYNLYGAGTSVTASRKPWLGGLGFGRRLFASHLGDRPADVDLDVMSWWVQGADRWTDLALLHRVRLTGGARFGRLTLFAGVTANLFVSDTDGAVDAFQPRFDVSWRRAGVTTRIWPSVFVGARLH